MNYKKNCVTYWLPKLVGLKIPVPRTIAIDMNKIDKNFVGGMRKIFWMKEPNDKQKVAFSKFRHMLERMGHDIGYPLFLRTGHSSHKHHWSETCFVKSQDQLLKHAQNLAEYSIMVDFKGGLPINIWVVRKLLETSPAFTAFDGMPITKEMRYFIKDGKIICRHPYWPEKAISGHTKDKNWKSKLKKMNKLTKNDSQTLEKLTQRVANKFKGYWSVDWLKDKHNKWYAIDMATGEDSYHWPGCPNRTKKQLKK